MDFETFIQALRKQESGSSEGNYDAVGGINVEGQGRALGAYQIMPDNWQPWSRQYLGRDGDINSPQDQDAVAQGKLKDLFDAYGAEGALVAWYSGDQNGERWKNGAPDAIGANGGHYSWDAPQDGGAPSIKGYVHSAMGNASPYHITGVDNTLSPYGTVNPTIVTKETPPESFAEYFMDRTKSGFMDNGLVAMGRSIFARGDSAPVPDYTPTHEDFTNVKRSLPNDLEAQRWCLLNAGNPEQLANMVAMKQDDHARELRMEAYVGNLKAKQGTLSRVSEYSQRGVGFLGEMAGMVAGSPEQLMFPAIRSAGLVTKLAEKLGVNALSEVGLSKLAGYVDSGLMGSLFNVEHDYVSHTYGYGRAPDYTSSALMGFAGGTALHGAFNMLGSVFSRHTEGERILSALSDMETHSVTVGTGTPSPSAVRSLRAELEGKHDNAFVTGSGSTKLSQLAGSGKVLVVSKADLGMFKNVYGIHMDNTKAFHSASEDLTVIVRDNLKSTDKIDNVLAHERGVHAGLKSAPENLKKSVENTVRDRMDNPDASWTEAIQAVKGGGWEEVLGHWIEKNVDAKDPLMSQLKQTFRKVAKQEGMEGKMSDIELKDMIKRSLQHEADTARGYQELPDGTVIKGGVQFSNNNILNPALIDHLISTEATFKRPWVEKAFGSASRWLESGWIYQTPFGTMVNSKSKVAREYAVNLLNDARQRGRSPVHGVSAEMYKAHLRGQNNVFVGKFLDARTEYMADTKIQGNVIGHDSYLDFNKQVREYYNSVIGTHKWTPKDPNVHPKVVECAKILDDLYRNMEAQGKESGERGGAGAENNAISKDYEFNDRELWRRIDSHQWQRLIKKFGYDEKAMQEFLYTYAKTNIKQDIIRQRLEYGNRKTYEAEMETYNKTMAGLKPTGKKVEVNPELRGVLNKPELRATTEEHLADAVEREARSWAKGVGDQNISNLDVYRKNVEINRGGETDKGSIMHDGEFLESRTPMDTSAPMETPWGEMFSYDSHLRSDDLDKIIPKIVNRYSGELAINNHFNEKGTTLSDARAKIAQSLEAGRVYSEKTGVTESDVSRTMNAFDETIADLRGFRRDENYKGKLHRLVNTLTGFSYAQNGTWFGANQLGETFGAIGVGGWKVLAHYVPSLSSHMRDIRAGKGASNMADQAELHLFGEQLEARTWGTDAHTSAWQEASSVNSVTRLLDGIDTAVKVSGRVTSTLSQLPRLTDRMLRGLRKDAIIDTVRWAEGEHVGWDIGVAGRRPFSDTHLKNADIDREMAITIKDSINKYMVKDAQGSYKSLNTEQWLKDDAGSFWRWKNLIENQSQRGMTQHTIGNKSLMTQSSPQAKLFFQFKDFTMKTMNSQVMRMMTNGSKDDVLTALYSMAGNALVYSAMIGAKSLAIGDPVKAQKYRDDRLTTEQIAMAGILRSNLGTATSFIQDGYQIGTGKQLFRTTVQTPIQQRREENSWGDPTKMMGNAFNQLPAIQGAIDWVQAGASGARLASDGKTFGRRKSQEDLQNLFNLFPARTSIPMLKLLDTIQEESNLPKKPRT